MVRQLYGRRAEIQNGGRGPQSEQNPRDRNPQ